MLIELALMVFVEVIHPLPQLAFARRIRLILLPLTKRNIRDAALDEREAAIIETIIALVG